MSETDERIEALEARCVLYAASLRKADARAEALVNALHVVDVCLGSGQAAAAQAAAQVALAQDEEGLP